MQFFQLSPTHIVSMFGTIAFIIIIGIASVRKVHTNDDFQTGGKNYGTFMVTGVIVGSLIGGSCTLGAAEMAFDFGISGWWYAIGCSVGCLIIALLYVKPFRANGKLTLQELIYDEFGQTAGILTSLIAPAGFLAGIVSQIAAAGALLTTLMNISMVQAVVVSIVIMISYAAFGGMKISGFLGVVKVILLYITVIGGGALALYLAGGLAALNRSLDPEVFNNFFVRGVTKELSSVISVSLGMLSTQTYIQAIVSAKRSKNAVNACLLSALTVLPVGLFSSWIGMYMRTEYPFIAAAQSFPLFIVNKMPPFVGGICLAGLLIVIISAGASMALGLSSVFSVDIYRKYINKCASDRRTLAVNRITVLAVMLISFVMAAASPNTLILEWGYLSFSLRLVGIVLPGLACLFFPGKLHPVFVTVSGPLGLAVMLLIKILHLTLDPTAVGFCTALIVCAAGYFIQLAKTIIKQM